MQFNPIHAPHVALAQTLALATRVENPAPVPDPAQLLLLSECAGRPYVTALGGLLVMNYFRKHRLAR